MGCKFKVGDVIRAHDKPESEHMIIGIRGRIYELVCLANANPILVGKYNAKSVGTVDTIGLKVRDATKAEMVLYVK